MPNGTRCVTINHQQVKALLVGINYRGTEYALGGCINDVAKVSKLITDTYGSAQIEILTDDTHEKPTRENILKKLTALVNGAKAGDLLIFDYSGHGSQVPDLHGDEADGLDETICPIDFLQKRVITYNGKRYTVDNQITNDEINAIVTNLPAKAKFLMLSDSCHSGTIAELKNDFLRYDGPMIWPNKKVSGTSTPSQTEEHPGEKPEISSNALTDLNAFTFTCQAGWLYLEVDGIPQIWLTPQRYEVFEKFNLNHHVIKLRSEEVPSKLKEHQNQIYSTTTFFKEVAPKEFIVSSQELGIENLKINLTLEASLYHQLKKDAVIAQRKASEASCTSLSNSFSNQIPRLVQLPSGEQCVTTCNVSSHYDPITGNHEHINYTTGEKNTLNMRSHNCCKGGELRVISGCKESQTSADTGRNGACTLAFLETVNKLGGLEKLLLKLFSHNIQDLKAVQDHINSFLMRHGFTQESMVSWDHSIATRALLARTGMEVLNQFNTINQGLNSSMNYVYLPDPIPELTLANREKNNSNIDVNQEQIPNQRIHYKI